jgi:GNAT superfamily N-acetyltransferase
MASGGSHVKPAEPSMLDWTPMEAPTAYELDDNPARVDMDAVWGFLSTEAYWGRWRTRDIVEQQVRSAWRVIGAYEHSSGKMVGFARALSDGCALAYLADVFVLSPDRGQGLGVRLVRAMIEQGPGAKFLWMLHTADAQGLYAKFGFAPREDARYRERRSQFG